MKEAVLLWVLSQHLLRAGLIQSKNRFAVMTTQDWPHDPWTLEVCSPEVVRGIGLRICSTYSFVLSIALVTWLEPMLRYAV